MANKRCYYEVLGVSRSANDGEISANYRRLAIQYHPDKNPGDDQAIARFKEAAEAFEVLSDSHKRQRYDQFGHAGVDSEGGGAHFHDVSDIFEAFGDIFGGGVFGDIFGGGGGRTRRVRRGRDVQSHVSLTLFEAARGTTKNIQFSRHKACDTCGGSGAAPGSGTDTCDYCGGRGQVIQSSGILRMTTTCPACHGAGRVIRERCGECRGEAFVPERVTKEVVIPAGVDSGMRIRVSGEGEPSPNGGPPGDCYCLIEVEEHALFQRDGQNLICHLPITFTQAALGATVEVPTLEGPRDLDIPSGTQPNKVFTLRRLGMPDPRGGSRKGDLLVQVQIEVPKKLTGRQEELLREMAELEHAHVTPHRKSFLKTLRDYFVPEESEAAQPKE
ncbi:MAG: molecular chaperone DnaJ [Pirellulales bacterium]